MRLHLKQHWLPLLAARAVLVFALTITGVLLAGCADDGAAPTVEPTRTSAFSPIVQVQWPNVAIDEVIADPGAFVGKQVVVHGEVAEVLSPNALTIADAGEVMLVVGRELPVERLNEGDFVRVDGAVRDFDIAEIEEELGVPLDAELLETFDDEPAVIAAVITVGPTSIDDLLENAGIFLGRTVSVAGRVTDLPAENTFALLSVDGDQALRVKTPAGATPPITEDTWIRATGTLRLAEQPPEVGEGDLPLDERLVLAAEDLEPIAPAATVSAAEVLEAEPDLTGERVTLAGQIVDVPQPGVFALEADGLVPILSDELLVFVPPASLPADLELTEQMAVVVIGTVLQLEDGRQQLAQRGIELEDPALLEGVDQPAVVADEVVIIARE